MALASCKIIILSQSTDQSIRFKIRFTQKFSNCSVTKKKDVQQLLAETITYT